MIFWDTTLVVFSIALRISVAIRTSVSFNALACTSTTRYAPFLFRLKFFFLIPFCSRKLGFAYWVPRIANRQSTRYIMHLQREPPSQSTVGFTS